MQLESDDVMLELLVMITSISKIELQIVATMSPISILFELEQGHMSTVERCSYAGPSIAIAVLTQLVNSRPLHLLATTAFNASLVSSNCSCRAIATPIQSTGSSMVASDPQSVTLFMEPTADCHPQLADREEMACWSFAWKSRHEESKGGVSIVVQSCNAASRSP